MNTKYYTIIHKIGSEDLTKNVYGLIFCEVDSELMVNGSVVFGKTGQKIKVLIRDITLISGSVVLLGHSSTIIDSSYRASSPVSEGDYIVDDIGNVFITDTGLLLTYEI